MTKSFANSIHQKFDEALNARGRRPQRVPRKTGGSIPTFGSSNAKSFLASRQTGPLVRYTFVSIISLLTTRLRRIIAGNPGTGFLLSFYEWIEEYKKNLEVPPEWLEPPPLEGKEQGLLEDEWSKNLMTTDVFHLPLQTSGEDPARFVPFNVISS